MGICSYNHGVYFGHYSILGKGFNVQWRRDGSSSRALGDVDFKGGNWLSRLWGLFFLFFFCCVDGLTAYITE